MFSEHVELQRRCAEAMEVVVPVRRAHEFRPSRDRVVEVSMYTKHWHCLLPQHGPGRKHTRPIVLEPWQQEIVYAHPQQLVRGLIHSDGKAYEYGRYQFCNRSEDIHGLFTDALDRLDIPWRRMNRWNISVARRDGVAALDAFVERKA